MDFNLPPEMERNVVYYGELFPILKHVTQLIMDVSDNSAKHINQTLDIMGEFMDKVRYERYRDTRFFLSLLNDLGYGPEEKLVQHYIKWCDEYDRLNKGDKS